MTAKFPALNHFNEGGAAHMVDVGSKHESERLAIAEGYIVMASDTMRMVIAGGHQKGDVLGIARLAGIMASKRTADLIPLCHPLALTHVDLSLEPEPAMDRIRCCATVKTVGRTGVEIEALLAVQVALLTIYDMCKAVDRGMVIEQVRLLEKSGGRSGIWQRQGQAY